MVGRRHLLEAQLAFAAISRLLIAGALVLVTPAASAEDWDRLFSPTLGDLRADLAEVKASGRKGMVIMYHFEECPYCQRMKTGVLAQREVHDWYLREFVAVAIDTRGSQAITGLDGKVLPERDFARAQGLRGTPTFDFIAPDGTPVYRHVGALYDTVSFVGLGRYVASGAYRSQTFKAFLNAQPQ